MHAIFLLHATAYCGAIVLLWIAWRQQGRSVASSAEAVGHAAAVALIVPFRNELHNLGQMVHQVSTGIPAEWEVIWVDDHSDDGSMGFMEAVLRMHSFGSWRVIQSEGIGKKRALEAGIRAARAELIVTTDADVLFTGNPFASLVEAFSNKRVHLAAGPVLAAHGIGVLAAFQQVEWASVQLITGATFQLGAPLMCSGANLSFRRSTFFEVEGYAGNFQHLSGDDEFLLKKVAARFGRDSVAFVPDQHALVQIRPFRYWSHFVAQRQRWASKWRLHGSFGHAFGSVLGFFFPVCFLFSPLLFATGEAGIWLFGVVWMGKISFEGAALSAVLMRYGQQSHWSHYLWTSIAHPVFVAQVAVGAVRGNFTWKGRKSGLFH
ncbi:MAG: glycosyltransferase [Lunatimonas sp.]|uniref:glycosyltransferase n=1 Tax=Lunatimonas sp. TaxID=2060141 RepID=UPI00263A6B87|nr:glycosyltransferase [Lunatimonas sp.]MCC5936397.1 glycosyltransferase [Lunatimonas sp.]